jgi:hypothetical protein
MALFGLKAAAAGAAGALGADLYKKCTNSKCYIGVGDNAAISTIRAYMDEQKAINGQPCRVLTEVEVSVDDIVRFRIAARKMA